MNKIDTLSLIACILAALLIVSALLQFWGITLKDIILSGLLLAIRVWSWF